MQDEAGQQTCGQEGQDSVLPVACRHPLAFGICKLVDVGLEALELCEGEQAMLPSWLCGGQWLSKQT